MFQFKQDVKSHMPFAGLSENTNAPYQLCCLLIDGLWKLHHFKDGQWQRLETNLPADTTECSPTAEYDNGKWNVSFIAGGSEKERRFHLYCIFDAGGQHRIVKICPADAGYVQKTILVIGKQSGEIIIEKPEKKISLRFKDFEFLYRVSYNPFNPQEMLFSGQTFSGEISSRSYNIQTKKLEELFADGQPAYKAALWQDLCFYGKKTGRNFDSRTIAQARVFQRKPMSDDVLERTDERVDNIKKATDEDFE